MSKIVIDGRWIKQTGIGRYVEETLKEILKIDRKNQYVLLVRDQDRAKLNLHAPNLELVTANYQWYSLSEQTKLLHLINSLKADLVHFTNFNFPIRYHGKFVITIHDLTLLKFKNISKHDLRSTIYPLKDTIMRQVMKTATKKSVSIITPTQFVKNQIREQYGIRPSKIHVTPEAANKLNERPAVNLLKFGISKPFLLYVGNAYPHKNLERLILAFGRLITKYLIDYQLVIVGKKDNFHTHLEDEIKQANLSDRVIFTDFVTDGELAGFYKKARLYVFPSLSEGFGLPPLEAMGYGLPVASSNATCLPEVLGEAAEYFNPKSTSNMTAVMARLLANDERLAELSKLGQKQLKKYSWKKTAKETLEVYHKAVRARSPKRR